MAELRPRQLLDEFLSVPTPPGKATKPSDILNISIFRS